MRISTNQIHESGVRDMQRINQDLAQTQAQISSGKRLIRPSDDPVGASRIVDLNREVAQRATFIRNTENAESLIEQEESVLTRVIDITQRIQELTIQAGDAAQTFEDRKYIATEVEARLEELQGLVNSRGTDGTFIFAGNRGGRQPFIQDGDSIRYTGDQGQRILQVDRQLYVPTNDPGSRIFVDIPSVGPNFSVIPGSANKGTGVVYVAGISDDKKLSDLVPETLLVEFRPPSEAGGMSNYTIRRQSDQRVVEGLQNVTFQPGDRIRVGGMEMSVSGQPVEGDGFVISTGNTSGLLQTVSALVNGLRSIDAGRDPKTFGKLIDDTIGNLNNASDSILQVQSDIGARLNTLTATRTFHEEQNLATEALISAVRDVDYAEAVSRLSFQSFVLEAAQQSYLRVSQLSLFNAL